MQLETLRPPQCRYMYSTVKTEPRAVLFVIFAVARSRQIVGFDGPRRIDEAVVIAGVASW